MGYHSNEATTKKAVKDACRFINDRERLQHALILVLNSIGVEPEIVLKIIEEAKNANFEKLAERLEGK